MTDQHEFMTDAWMMALEQEAQKLLDATDFSRDSRVVYSESFPDSPSPGPDGKTLGYILTVSGGKVTVQPGVRGDEVADCTVRMGYAAAMASTRVRSGPELTELGRQAYASGALQMTGSLEGMPFSMNALHDKMCERTMLPA